MFMNCDMKHKFLLKNNLTRHNKHTVRPSGAQTKTNELTLIKFLLSCRK